MIEILTNLDLLKATTLELSELQLDGVQFGIDTVHFPRAKIVQVSSPLVASYRSGSGIPGEYFDVEGQQLGFEEVIESALSESGMVYFADKISFKITNRHVTGFALYGEHLHHFSQVKTYADFCNAFGSPDRVVPHESTGELMGYTHVFFGCRKSVYWDAFDHRIAIINLGGYDRNTQ